MIAFLTNLRFGISEEIKKGFCVIYGVGKSLESCAMSSKIKLWQYMERHLCKSFKIILNVMQFRVN